MARPRTVAMRRFARALRQLRMDRGLKTERVIQDLPKLKSSLFRAESAEVVPSLNTLSQFLDYYQADEAERAAMLALLAEAGADAPGWLRALNGRVPQAYSEFMAWEAEAHRIRCFEGYLIPGLLQIAEYVKAVTLAGIPNATDAYVASCVDARAKRQAAFFDPARGATLSVILGEAALRCEVGGSKVMKAQLLHLHKLAEDTAALTLRVLPFAAGAFGAMSASFVILDYPDPDDSPLLYLESAATEQLREGPEEIKAHRDLFAGLVRQALDPAASLQLLKRAVPAIGRR